MKKKIIIITSITFIGITGIVAAIINTSEKVRTSNVYYSNGSCITLDIANTHFTTTGSNQATILGDDGITYSLYSNANCTLPVYCSPAE